MLSMDFEKEINQILEVIPDCEKGRRTMLFSATMTSKVEKLQRASLVNPVRVEVSTKFQTPKKLLQSYLFIPAKYKDCYLTYLINEHAGQSILVFGATCNNVQRLALMLRNLGFPAICLHGQMSQPKRLGALTKFKAGGRDILICTDVASRGLDIPSVDVVINFDLPGHGKDYIHRVGRTARAGRSGKAIAMVTQYDVEVYQRLEHLVSVVCYLFYIILCSSSAWICLVASFLTIPVYSHNAAWSTAPRMQATRRRSASPPGARQRSPTSRDERAQRTDSHP